MSTFLSQHSLRFIPGDRITAGVIFDNKVYTFHATALSFETESIPYSKESVVATFTRGLFLDGDDFPEDTEQYIAPYDETKQEFEIPETGNMKQITHWIIEVDSDAQLPFSADKVPEQYALSDSIAEGKVQKLRIPVGLVVGRMITDTDVTPTFDCPIGRKIKSRIYVKNNKVTPPRKDHIELIGLIVDFEFSEFGVPRYIVKVLSHTSSDPENVKLKTLPLELYKTLSIAYPNSQFVSVDNEYKSTLAPEKIEAYHVEYLRALKKIIPGALLDGVFKEAIEKTTEFWYGFTNKGNYISPVFQKLKVSTDPETLLSIDVIDPPQEKDGKKRVVKKPKGGEVLFGYEIKNRPKRDEDGKDEKEEGKAIQWFSGRDYPGFTKFFDYVRHDKLPKPDNSKEGKERSKKAIDSMKNNGSPTMYSALIAGYYDQKLNHKVIQSFKKRYLWFL